MSDVLTWGFNTRAEARNVETTILNKFKHLKYIGTDMLLCGNTELFHTDISALIEKIIL